MAERSMELRRGEYCTKSKVDRNGRNWHSVTRLRVGGRGIVVRFTTGTRVFLNSDASRSALRFTQPCVQWAVRGLYPGENQPERKVDDSPSGAEIRNAWGCILTLPPHMTSRCAQGHLLHTLNSLDS